MGVLPACVAFERALVVITQLQRGTVALGKELDRTADQIDASIKSQDGPKIAEIKPAVSPIRLHAIRAIRLPRLFSLGARLA